MATNPNQDRQQNPEDRYAGGYRGTSARPPQDPYGAFGQEERSDPAYSYGSQQQSGYGQQQQQSQNQAPYTYEAPESVTRRRKDKQHFKNTAFSSLNVDSSVSSEDRRWAALSYVGLCFTGIFFFFWKGKSPFVRYHAVQSIAVFTPLLIVLMILGFLSFLSSIPILGFFFGIILGILNFAVSIPLVILWVVLTIMAFRGASPKVPIVGDFVERFTRRKATA